MTLQQSRRLRAVLSKCNLDSEITKDQLNAIVRQETDFYTERCAARLRDVRQQQLTVEVIERLINRFPENPPAWVHRIVDRLIIGSEKFSAHTKEVWG